MPDWKDNLWVQNAVLALLFFATGEFGHLIAIPPGLATPIWLPSGITVTAVILLGPRVWPGIVVGSVLTSLPPIEQLDSISAIASSLAVGTVVAVGVVAEPLLAARWYHRFKQEGQLLSAPHNVAILLLVIAPIGCAVSATIGAAVLATTGMIESVAVSETWMTWMVGDMAGIYLLAPALLT
jgi:integral membrane sensor domain MASE1